MGKLGCDDERCSNAAQQYRAGRFHDAAVTLEECEESLSLINNDDNNIICSPKVNVNNDVDKVEYIMTDESSSSPDNVVKTKRMAELVALFPLARSADIALCRFRSAMTVKVIDEDCISLRNKALHINARYIRALIGAASSLVRSATVRQRQQQRSEADDPSHYRQRMITDEKYLRRTMTDTALAMLMAGIAASYLYLHHDNTNDIEKNVDCSNKGVGSSWTVLIDTATLAANLILTKRALYKTNNSDVISDPTLLMVGGKAVNLEQSLIILNEETVRCVTNEDSERWNVAMHSFRTTCKVAALATGRLILPTISSRSENGSTPPFIINSGKRRRMEMKTYNKDQFTAYNNVIDAWNVIYIHSNQSLNARDRLVDAVSFHMALIHHPRKRRSLIELRETCFNEAIAWEDEADEWLSDNDNDVTTTSARGWKLRTCLHGLEIASSDLHLHPDHDGKSLVSVVDEEKKRSTIGALEKLASSSTSRFARELLGCIRANDDDPSRALEALQSSLDHGRRDESRISRSHDVVVDSMSDFRTVTNMSICFASMGESVVPLEILLHQWTMSQVRDSAMNAAPQPVIVCLSGKMDSTSSSPVHRLRCSKQQLLWQLFQASSLAQDWDTCLNAIEELLDEGVHVCDQLDARSRVDIARIFALLQCRQTTTAECDTHTLLVKLVPQKSEIMPDLPISRALLLSFAELYKADALLCMENVADNEHLWKCTQRVIRVLDSVLVQNNALLTELHISILNDMAIARLLKGDSVGALQCFQKAVSRLTFSGTLSGSMNNSPSWLVLPIYFNTSLLLLRDGRLDESAKSWLRVRGHFDTWQVALGGDNDALQRLKSLCMTTINRHGLLLAKRGTAMRLLDQEIVTNWFPPLTGTGLVMEDTTHVGGMDASQITAMDVLTLKYALSTIEKKSLLSFWRQV